MFTLLCQVKFTLENIAYSPTPDNPPSPISREKADIEQFYARLRAANPAPTTELSYTSTFQLLIAVILSAQATDVGVNKATARLFPVAPTPEKWLNSALKD